MAAVESGTRKMAKSVTASSTAIEGMGDRLKSWPQRTKSFYTEVRTEMKKVTTPSWKEVRGTSTVVIITVFLFGAFFFVIDYFIGHGIDTVLRYFAHR
jgi:preprotein translocase subunit SecE